MKYGAETAAMLCRAVLFGIVLLAMAHGAHADWAMRGHDAQHSGTADEAVLPPLGVMWKYKTGGAYERCIWFVKGFK